MSFQSVTVLGNVGRDPEIRALNNGDKVASFSIAVSEKRKGEDSTVWFNCTAFGKTAEVVHSYVNKGSKVLVQGRIQTREYEKDGVKRQAWEVIADRVSLESPKESGSSGGGANTGYSGRDDLDGDTIPFAPEFR